MNWYALMLEGRMRSEELIRKAAANRRAAAAACVSRARAAEQRARASRVTADLPLGFLQILWRRLFGVAAR